MAMIAMAVYGSVARGDQHLASDVDLLAVVTERPQKKLEEFNTNITFYNAFDLIKSGESGDLFALHIYAESRFIYDECHFEKEFKSRFRKKKSYSKEIYQASTLGWFLLQRYSDRSDFALFNRRAAWCARTVLIAKSAEIDHPRFSSDGLFDLFKSHECENLLKFKNSSEKNMTFVRDLRCFLTCFGDPRSSLIRESSLEKQLEIFRVSENKVAQQTAAELMRRVDIEY